MPCWKDLILHSSTYSNTYTPMRAVPQRSIFSITLTRIVAFYLDYTHNAFNADDCSSYLHSTYYCQRFTAFSRSSRADCPVSPTNATSTGGQIALWRLIDCKWPLTRHKQQATSRTVGRNSHALRQLSWNKIVTTLSGVGYARYTRITHSRQCCNYFLLVT